MRRDNKLLVLVYIVFILAVLWLAWWIAGEYYKPYPPATPTPSYWPTRVTATIVPSATPTKVIHTPIQPTIGYTATPVAPPVTVTSTPAPPTYTPTPSYTPTATHMTYKYPRDIEYEVWIFRGSRIIHYIWYRIFIPPQPLRDEHDVIWGPPIPKTPIYPVATFTGSPIFIP